VEERRSTANFSATRGICKNDHDAVWLAVLGTATARRVAYADFRTVGDVAVDQPNPNLLETIYAMQRRQTWMREQLIDDGSEELGFVGSVRKNRNYKSVAQRIRKTLELPVD